MKKTLKLIALVAVIGFTMIACNKSGGGGSSGGDKSFNNLEELSKYLYKQPANSPDNPIKVTISANDSTIKGFGNVIIMHEDKYVSLNITGDALLHIPNNTFNGPGGCKTLVSVTLPDSVLDIGQRAFLGCYNLTNVTIPYRVNYIGYNAFNYHALTNVTFEGVLASIEPSDSVSNLEYEYKKGGIGTYTNTGEDNHHLPIWTKK